MDEIQQDSSPQGSEERKDIGIEGNIRYLKASSGANVNNLASAIAALIFCYPTNIWEVRCMGAQAVNQTVKALIAAKSKVCDHGVEYLIKLYFKDIQSNDENQDKRSLICFRLIPQ